MRNAVTLYDQAGNYVGFYATYDLAYAHFVSLGVYDVYYTILQPKGRLYIRYKVMLEHPPIVDKIPVTTSGDEGDNGGGKDSDPTTSPTTPDTKDRPVEFDPYDTDDSGEYGDGSESTIGRKPGWIDPNGGHDDVQQGNAEDIGNAPPGDVVVTGGYTDENGDYHVVGTHGFDHEQFDEIVGTAITKDGYNVGDTFTDYDTAGWPSYPTSDGSEDDTSGVDLDDMSLYSNDDPTDDTSEEVVNDFDFSGADQ